jgi:hypothetical protein
MRNCCPLLHRRLASWSGRSPVLLPRFPTRRSAIALPLQWTLRTMSTGRVPPMCDYWAKDRRGYCGVRGEHLYHLWSEVCTGFIDGQLCPFPIRPGRHFTSRTRQSVTGLGRYGRLRLFRRHPPQGDLQWRWMYHDHLNRTNRVGSTTPSRCRLITASTSPDLAVESCGTCKSTTDAIDLDQGAHVRIERVRSLTRARERHRRRRSRGWHNVTRGLIQGRRTSRATLRLAAR